MSPSTEPPLPLPVTVVIPAHNRAGNIEHAVSSTLSQDPAGPAEVLVVDDCSTDDTAEVAERAGARVLLYDATAEQTRLATPPCRRVAAVDRVPGLRR